MSLTITVVLSTFNGEKYIYEQLESLRMQTKRPDEVIICDDCSIDQTVKIVQEYISKNKLQNWRLIINEKNKGWKSNFINLVSIAKGDIVFTCDQDDIWIKNKLETMEHIMDMDRKINVLVSYLIEKHENGKERIYPHKGDGRIIKIPITKNFMNVKYPGCTYCIRTSFAHKCNKYWKPSIPHDGLYWRLSMFDESLYELRKPLIIQRKHSDSTFAREAISSRNIDSKIEEIRYTGDMIDTIQKMLEESGNNKKAVDILDKALKWNNVRYEFLSKRKLLNSIELLLYLPFYQTGKRYILDILLVTLNKTRGSN